MNEIFAKALESVADGNSEVPSFKVKFDSEGLPSTGSNFKEFSPLSREIPKFKDVDTLNEKFAQKGSGGEREKLETRSDFGNRDEGFEAKPDSESVNKKSEIEALKTEPMKDGSLETREENKAETSETQGENNTETSDEKNDGFHFIPREDGHWEGEPGNSKWIPDSEHISSKYNPNGNTWGEILDKYGIDGIEFRDGEPDFSPVAEETVEIDDYSTDRDENYDSADQALADKWNAEKMDGRSDWTKEDIKQYRKDHELSWHECADMKTMQLVPREVHLNIPHSGGIHMAKNS